MLNELDGGALPLFAERWFLSKSALALKMFREPVQFVGPSLQQNLEQKEERGEKGWVML